MKSQHLGCERWDCAFAIHGWHASRQLKLSEIAPAILSAALHRQPALPDEVLILYGAPFRRQLPHHYFRAGRSRTMLAIKLQKNLTQHLQLVTDEHRVAAQHDIEKKLPRHCAHPHRAAGHQHGKADSREPKLNCGKPVQAVWHE